MNHLSADRVHTDAMIDLELLGLEYGRPIIQIGVTLFTLSCPESSYVTRTFHVHAGPDELANACPQTMAWWHETDPELLQQLISDSSASEPLSQVLAAFVDFLNTAAPARFWADYTHFDIAHLQFAMQRAGLTPPWGHHQVHASNDVKLMCRLLLGSEQEVAPHPGRREHEAGSDTLQQAIELKAWFRQLAQALPASAMGSLPGAGAFITSEAHRSDH